MELLRRIKADKSIFNVFHVKWSLSLCCVSDSQRAVERGVSLRRGAIEAAIGTERGPLRLTGALEPQKFNHQSTGAKMKLEKAIKIAVGPDYVANILDDWFLV